jgi:hypothetical protein
LATCTRAVPASQDKLEERLERSDFAVLSFSANIANAAQCSVDSATLSKAIHCFRSATFLVFTRSFKLSFPVSNLVKSHCTRNRIFEFHASEDRRVERFLHILHRF